MYLKRLTLLNFKNHQEAGVELGIGANAFVGNNGAGKTNVLDAVHYLSLCKSHFNPYDSQNIRNDEGLFVIQGTFDRDGQEDNVYCGLKRNQKKQFKLNQKEYERLADHIGLFPCVMIAPTDVSLITDGSDERRKLIDSIISQYDKVYLDDLINYNRILTQRNALLKQFAQNRKFDLTMLEIFDEQLIPLGTSIYSKRSDFIAQFMPLFLEFYRIISGNTEQVEIDYDSDLKTQAFNAVLINARDKDRAMQYSTAGTHKDDLVFKINDFPVKRFGSQGQQKSFLIALKLAQFQLLKKITGFKPLLLLDDIFDKLDEARVSSLMQLVSNDDFGQLLITDTNQERIYSLFSEIGVEVKIFEVANGTVTESDFQ